MEFLNAFLTIVLVLVSIVMVFLVLMQRGSANGGLGSAMGGGMAESALGAETSSVLASATRKVAIVFFVMCFGLYLSHLKVYEDQKEAGTASGLPTITAAPEDAALDALLSGETEAVEAPAAEATEAAEEAAPATTE